ncbi:hypothetical protein P775_22255 [Puniceibacterium antarcticum]|uniref:Uncharacterized protein n=1 Tax=Puniceibacterium antarcticum TaxID=1206336 RepID=A0A2G8R8V7_9RHOB|nr:hypothetical protein [Puniceibacterium antarcticum]PIL17959.1 hypothetical protein P775_22255 [Puniceibacterium antarcticum]
MRRRGPQTDDPIAAFGQHLHAEGFGGDLADDGGTSAVFSTDNSVDELPPLAVVFSHTP